MQDIADRKKRILLITPMLHQGGFERICAMTAKLLCDVYEVHVVVFSSQDMFYDVSGVDLIDLQLEAVQGRLGKLVNIIKRVRCLHKLKKELKIDVSYSFGTTANIANVLSKYKDKTWAGIRGYNAIQDSGMKMICKKADKVISCTRIMNDDLCEIFGIKNSATLYNPCNLKEIDRMVKEEPPKEFKDFLDKSGKLIVSMGREDDLKGFWHLIKSFSVLKQELTDAGLIIIGDGEYTEYRKLARELKIEESVLFTGVQKNPFSILARADVYALTSESEGFPNALVEAMACGLPCVSVNCKTGPAEILEDAYVKCADQNRFYQAEYGILTPVFTGVKNVNPNEISVEEKNYASCLLELLRDDRAMEKYHKKSMERASHFGMECYVRNIEQLIEGKGE